ncbi:MAG: endonuclease/exonuclease/phosphatase family protein, partial [Desulfobacterales bacterium]
MRIITINTWKGDGDYPRRLALLAAGLQELAPDVLCLQESLQVPHSGPDTARHLADRLQLNLAWAPSRLKKRHVTGRPRPCFSGLAILSRHPIRQHRRLALPAHRKDPERIAQWIDIAVDHHVWRVVNLHLTHIREAAALRQKQLTETLAQVDRCGSPDTAWL